MTQIEAAKQGIITDEMKIVAEDEKIEPRLLAEDIAWGYTIITKSTGHACRPIGIGKGLRIKINANIGTSNFCSDVSQELEKMNAAVKYGADTIMDLSTGGDLDAIRRRIVTQSPVPVGTVPIYQAIVSEPDVAKISENDLLDAVFRHIEDGVDFITVHCGIKRDFIPLLSPRIMGVVSRGGSFLVKWMMHHKKENPLFTHFDDILVMAKKHDVTLSLGDGLRPGCISDATDDAQIAELKTLGELQARALAASVQVMIEGPGHVPIQDIGRNIKLEKELCHDAPFYVLGPLVTDIAPGYDHIVGAIGGAIAAMAGADFLCYLTPAEHLGLPGLDQVIEGVIASKIAAHAADVSRGLTGAQERDNRMAKARSELDWEAMFSLAMNPDKARAMRKEFGKESEEVCSMCGNFCSVKINRECRAGYKTGNT